MVLYKLFTAVWHSLSYWNGVCWLHSFMPMCCSYKPCLMFVVMTWTFSLMLISLFFLQLVRITMINWLIYILEIIVFLGQTLWYTWVFNVHFQSTIHIRLIRKHKLKFLCGLFITAPVISECFKSREKSCICLICVESDALNVSSLNNRIYSKFEMVCNVQLRGSVCLFNRVLVVSFQFAESRIAESRKSTFLV